MQHDDRTVLDQQLAAIASSLAKLKERDELLRDILDEVNHDFAHYGPSWLSEKLLKRIEKIVLEK